MKKFVEVRTTENSRVYLRKEQVVAIEEVPASTRLEAYLKIYAGGFAFSVKEEAAVLIKKLEEEG